MYVYARACVCVVCQLCKTSSHISSTRRPNHEDGHDICPKYVYVGDVYNNYKNTVQIFGGESFIFHVLFGFLHHLFCLLSRY